MCPECHRFICKESCPAYSGRSPESGRALFFCSLCGAALQRGEKFYTIRTRAFCQECLEEADSDELMKLFQYKCREDLLNSLGAVSRIALMSKEGT